MSLLGVHPSGLASQSNGDRLTTGFGPHPPDYAAIAIAASAGWAWGKKVTVGADLQATVKEAVDMVLKERRCAVLDVVLEPF